MNHNRSNCNIIIHLQRFLNPLFSNLSSTIIFLSFLNTYTNINRSNAADEKTHTQIQVIPRIKLTEKNSLKSYNWWDKEKPQIPIIYKKILKKIKDDFLLEHYELDFKLSKVSKENIQNYENYYVLTGNLVLDSKDKENHTLIDLSVYKVENKILKLILVAGIPSYDVHSSYRNLALELKQKLNPMISPESKVAEDLHYLVVFENELTFDEINQIRAKINETLNIPIDDVVLFFSENNKYTLKVKTATNPFQKLKDVTFVRGPYQSKIQDREMTFFPFQNDDFDKTESEDELY